MSKFQVGDKIIDSQRGEGVVVDVEVGENHPIFVKIDCWTHSYTSDGKFNAIHKYPALFHLEGYIPPSSPEPKRLPDLAVDTKMIVGDGNHKRHFSHWDDIGNCCCFNSGGTSFTTTLTSPWESWSVYEGDE